MNALALTELALNMKEPKIHKTVYIDGVEKKIVDREATIVAQQKQELIKQTFTKWIFADKDRRDRLIAYFFCRLSFRSKYLRERVLFAHSFEQCFVFPYL